MQTPSDPKAAKKRSQQIDIALGVALLVVVAAGVFQIFLRYTYVHTTGDAVVRVDRVTGDTCVLPCTDGYGPVTEAYTPPPSPRPEKSCHAANVVRVARRLKPPATRTPTPYLLGGFRKEPTRRVWLKHGLDQAVELTDGHIYVFSKDSYAGDVVNWWTGQDVQVCATWSQLEQRPYYSVGVAGEADPATLAL